MHLGILLFFSNLFSTDMVLIVIVALVLFGGDKLPGIAKAVGKGLRDFKEASEGVKRELNNQIYAYEEKKQDQRLDAVAAKTQEAAANPELAAAENTTPVANTIPFSEGAHTEIPSVTTEIEPANEAPEKENHIAAAPAETGEKASA
jgi:sec-independent protein translocase protein TatA